MGSYLDHHGQRLVERFDAAEYERRVRAMDTHDAGRARGGWRAALAPHADRLTAVGIVGDTLYSANIVQAWADGVGASFASMTSIHGHDAFLLERDADACNHRSGLCARRGGTAGCVSRWLRRAWLTVRAPAADEASVAQPFRNGC